MKAKLILVGGFLGAGKTSLLWETAKRLTEKKTKVGLITNDQASELVDTSFLETISSEVREVSGSCFCCNFGGFFAAIRHIADKNPGGIIMAEPVGSCTDLSATLMQPIKDKFGDGIELAPLTVLADPSRLRAVLDGASSDATYIQEKQFEESDILLINKSDLVSGDELAALIERSCKRWPDIRVLSASVKTGAGLDDWIAIAMAETGGGRRIADVDYATYAAGEAAFGWVNAKFSLARGNFDMRELAAEFMDAMGKRFKEVSANIGHVKFLLQGTDCMVMGNIVGKDALDALRVLERKCGESSITINARVEIPAKELESIILDAVSASFGKIKYEQVTLNCLTPGAPNPTYRYSDIIG
jgi:Ni2+-binding GTPase involved in maturation of urease and hydrogenase